MHARVIREWHGWDWKIGRTSWEMQTSRMSIIRSWQPRSSNSRWTTDRQQRWRFYSITRWWFYTCYSGTHSPFEISWWWCHQMARLRWVHDLRLFPFTLWTILGTRLCYLLLMANFNHRVCRFWLIWIRTLCKLLGLHRNNWLSIRNGAIHSYSSIRRVITCHSMRTSLMYTSNISIYLV